MKGRKGRVGRGRKGGEKEKVRGRGRRGGGERGEVRRGGEREGRSRVEGGGMTVIYARFFALSIKSSKVSSDYRVFAEAVFSGVPSDAASSAFFFETADESR